MVFWGLERNTTEQKATTVTIVCHNLAKKVLEGESHYERVKGGCKIDFFGIQFTFNTAWEFHQKQKKKCCLKAWAGSLGLQRADPHVCDRVHDGKVPHSWPSDQKSALPRGLQAIVGYAGMDFSQLFAYSKDKSF